MKIKSAAGASITAICDAKMKEQQQRRQCPLLKHLASLRYLARQGIAFRGHEGKEGNMMQLL